MQRFAIRRAVDQQRAVYAHKLPGTLGGSVCSENIRQAEPEPPHSPANGQHNRCGVCQQNGGAHTQAPYRTWRAASGSCTFRGASHCLQNTSQGFTTKQQMPNPEPFTPQPNGNCFLQYSGGTSSSYQSGWKKWGCWCSRREIDPFSCDIRHFLDFLSELFEDGLQHRTINSIRSAVSMTHDQVEGVPIGQHPLVTRLLKGVYNLRPPQPRYSDTWNVDMVIQHLQSLGNNSKLTLKVLGQKLALLMALVEASRSSELHALDVRYRVFKPEGVLFSLPTLTKKRTCGAPPKH